MIKISKIGSKMEVKPLRRGKIGKHRKVEVRIKLWVLVHPSYSPQGNRRQSSGVEITSLDHLTGRITQGTSIIKGWENKRDRGRIPDIFK